MRSTRVWPVETIEWIFSFIVLPLAVLSASHAAERQGTSRIVHLRADDVTTIVARFAEPQGTFLGKEVKQGFHSSKDRLTWTVVAPETDDYAVSLIYSTPRQEAVEVSCKDSVLRADSIVPDWQDRPFYWRQHLPGMLHLDKGVNRIALRLPTAKHDGEAVRTNEAIPIISKKTHGFAVFSIELGTPEARRGQIERARSIRGDASWMVEGKYGLFVHWSPLSYAFHGDKPRSDWHEEAVNLFDVRVFADAVERTGAAWMIFTVTHGGFYWPGPSEAVDKVLPGRTANRDLLGEIIEELDQRDIRTLFYFHSNASYEGDQQWAQAVGALDEDTTQFGNNIEAILRESSIRYGRKLKGYGYIDGTVGDYPLDPPWERWARAIKAGNPDAVVGFSSHRIPSVSPFSELAVTDGGGHFKMPNTAVIGPGKQLGDVKPAIWMNMDSWVLKGPMNGRFAKGPRHDTQAYVEYFKKMDEADIPVTINMISTADVVSDHPIFDPACMAVMEEVRKAIRGK